MPRARGWPPNTFLGGLPAAVAEELVGIRPPRTFPGGQPILREGDRGTHVVLLLSGFAKVSTSIEGTDVLLAIRTPGELVGEAGALTKRARNATVTACGSVSASVIFEAEFQAVQQRHPQLRARLVEALAAQVDWANRRRTDFAVYPAHVRLARVLVEIAETCGRELPDGRVEIAVPLSQTEIAAMIAVAQATVEKAIQELKRRGLIQTGYRRLTVLDSPTLREVADGSDRQPPTP